MSKNITSIVIMNTGVKNLSAHDFSTELSIFPNPNSGVFYIQSNSESIYNIVNELGQVVQTVKLNYANNNSVAVENLSSGIYFIIGYNDHKMTSQKVIVTK